MRLAVPVLCLSCLASSASAAVSTELIPTPVPSRAQAASVNAPVIVKASAKGSAKNEEYDDDARRCAFLGRFGAFTIINAEGTAAYKLGNGKYIADLKHYRDDANWWLYKPAGNGDPATTMWAFARKPRCGTYQVLRFANGAWRKFESTDAWGLNIGAGGIATAADVSGPTNQDLLDKLRELEGKLNTIQPGLTPSLQDLENQIKAK